MIFKSKKGVMFFTIDALMAGVILTLTIVFMLSVILKTPESIDAKYYIEGYLDYVTSTKMSEINENYKFVYYDLNEKNPDLLIYQKVMIMKNNPVYTDELVASFVDNFTRLVVPGYVGVEYNLDGEVIYSRYPERIVDANIYLSTTILTFVFDESGVMYGPNVTKLSVWV